MAEKEPFGFQRPPLTEQQLAEKLNRVDELVNILLDDELSDTNVSELESLLVETPEARSQYVGMIQLHTDLLEYYNPTSRLKLDAPVLSQLGKSGTAAPATEQPAE